MKRKTKMAKKSIVQWSIVIICHNTCNFPPFFTSTDCVSLLQPTVRKIFFLFYYLMVQILQCTKGGNSLPTFTNYKTITYLMDPSLIPNVPTTDPQMDPKQSQRTPTKPNQTFNYLSTISLALKLFNYRNVLEQY